MIFETAEHLCLGPTNLLIYSQGNSQKPKPINTECLWRQKSWIF